MSTPSRRVPLILLPLLALLLACSLSGLPAAPTTDPFALATSVAQTVAAAVNLTLTQPVSPSISSTPSLAAETPAPPALSTETFTPIPSLSPTSFFTGTPATPLLSVSVDTNCRVGPGKVYDWIGGLYVGQSAEVYGKSADGKYWYIRLPENPSQFCWVTGQYATIAGNASILPVYTPPPTPTPAPGFEMSYAKTDHCTGWWVDLKIKNTGGLAFKSMSLTLKDLDTSVTLSSSSNGFIDNDGCLISAAIASLDPGASYTVSAPAFAYDPNNHKLRATIILCTKLNQGGQCISNTITFKP